MFTQPFIQTQIKENIKAPRHRPLCREFTGGAVNSSHKWPVTRKMFPFDDVIMSPDLPAKCQNVKYMTTSYHKWGIMYVLKWRAVYALTRVLFWCLLFAELRRKIKLSWVHKHFVTTAHTTIFLTRHYGPMHDDFSWSLNMGTIPKPTTMFCLRF